MVLVGSSLAAAGNNKNMQKNSAHHFFVHLFPSGNTMPRPSLTATTSLGPPLGEKSINTYLPFGRPVSFQAFPSSSAPESAHTSVNVAAHPCVAPKRCPGAAQFATHLR
eukprot:3593753-Prymnesium_polylepis.1